MWLDLPRPGAFAVPFRAASRPPCGGSPPRRPSSSTPTFGSYGRLFGSLAGVVVFLVWLWVSNLALRAGAQFTVELHHEAIGSRTA